MEWLVLIAWLAIINGGLGGQYILNWMGNQPRFVGEAKIGVTPGVMTFWREISKLAWALVATIIEVFRGKELKYLFPGSLSMITIVICAFTGVIENVGFFYLPRYYSPHVFAPYVNIYLAFLPFMGKLLFNATVRKEHWFGVILVVLGLATPHLPNLLGAAHDAKSALDASAIVWILIINLCLGSQQILNNKTVQTALPNTTPNVLVLWREIWKMGFITTAIFIFPLIGGLMNVNLPEKIEGDAFNTRVLAKLDTRKETDKKEFMLKQYDKQGNDFVLKQNITEVEKQKVKEVISSVEYNRFFSLFEGSILPKNWIPIFFVIGAGLTGYIYSFGFFKLSRFAAHFWVPYTNMYLAILPLIMLFFGQDVNRYQIIGAVITTAGLMVGVSDYSRNKVEEIEKRYKDDE